jgi:hypothetical protein
MMMMMMLTVTADDDLSLGSYGFFPSSFKAGDRWNLAIQFTLVLLDNA